MSDSAELGFFTQPGEFPAGSVSNAELANMADGTVKLRALGAGTGVPVDGTGAQVGEILRWAAVVDTTTSGVQTAYPIPATCGYIRFSPFSGAIDFQGIAAPTSPGQRVLGRLGRSAPANSVIFRHENAGATGQMLNCPGNRDVILQPGDAFWLQDAEGRWNVGVTSNVDPQKIAPVASTIAVPFQVYVSCPSGGAAGTADDVTVWNANAPFAMRILDATLRVSTAVGGSTAALRTASGGGGSVVLPDPGAATQTFSTATTGPHDDVAVATATVAANGSLFLRRSDRSAVGELILTCIRT